MKLASLCFKFVEIIMGIIEPAVFIGVSKVHDVVVITITCSIDPWVDDVMSQSVHKVQPPCAEHVVREDEVLFREFPDS